MFGILNIWKPASIVTGILAVLVLGWALRLDHLRAGYQTKFNALDAQAKNALTATQEASNNPKLVWTDVPGQVLMLGASNIRLKSSIDAQNASIDAMASETIKLKTQAADLQKQADAAQLQRKSAVAKLGDMVKTPAPQDNCAELVKEADEALNLVRDAGL